MHNNLHLCVFFNSDNENMFIVKLTDEQYRFLKWLRDNDIINYPWNITMDIAENDIETI